METCGEVMVGHPIPRLRPLVGLQPNLHGSGERKGYNHDTTRSVSKADRKVGTGFDGKVEAEGVELLRGPARFR